MRAPRILLSLCCAVATTPGSSTAGEPMRAELFSGHVSAGWVYSAERGPLGPASVRVNGESVKIYRSLQLARVRLPQVGQKRAEVTQYSHAAMAPPVHSFLRWRIHDDLYWGGLERLAFVDFHIIPVKDLAKFKNSSEAESKAYEKMSLAEKRKLSQLESDHMWSFGSDLEQVIGEPFTITKVQFADLTGKNQKKIFCERLPISKNRVWLFILVETRLQVFQADLNHECNWGDFGDGVPYLIMDKTPFCESYHVYKAGEDLYFLTDTGRAYALRSAVKKDRKWEKVWDDAKKPLRGIIVDVDKDKTYVFAEEEAKGKATGKGEYFALGRNAKPKAFQRQPWPDRDLPQSMRDVLEYVKVLQDDGHLPKKQ